MDTSVPACRPVAVRRRVHRRTTNTGAVDPLDAIADLAARERLWHHVDGAYGAFFRLCGETAAALHGIERADSLTLDPHKGLFLPYGTGALPELSLFPFHAVLKEARCSLAEENALIRKLVADLTARGRVLVTGCTTKDRFYGRVCVLSFRTHRHHIDALVEDVDASLASLRANSL